MIPLKQACKASGLQDVARLSNTENKEEIFATMHAHTEEAPCLLALKGVPKLYRF
jgi:hypothetical protein